MATKRFELLDRTILKCCVEYLWEIFRQHSENTQTIVGCRLHPIVSMNNKAFVTYPHLSTITIWSVDDKRAQIIKISKFKRQVLMMSSGKAKSFIFWINSNSFVNGCLYCLPTSGGKNTDQGVRESARVPQLVMLCCRWAHLQCFAGRTFNALLGALCSDWSTVVCFSCFAATI